MSGLSKMIADFFVRENVIEHEEYEIYKYGSDILIENIGTTIFLICLGFIFNKEISTLIFIAVFAGIRRYSGGYHAKTKLKCYILTITNWAVVIVLQRLQQKFGFTRFGIELIICCMVFMVMFFFAPVENPGKPLFERVRIVNKRKTLIITLMVIIISLSIRIKLPDASFAILVVLIEVICYLISRCGIWRICLLEGERKMGRKNCAVIMLTSACLVLTACAPTEFPEQNGTEHQNQMEGVAKQELTEFDTDDVEKIPDHLTCQVDDLLMVDADVRLWGLSEWKLSDWYATEKNYTESEEEAHELIQKMMNEAGWKYEEKDVECYRNSEGEKIYYVEISNHEDNVYVLPDRFSYSTERGYVSLNQSDFCGDYKGDNRELYKTGRELAFGSIKESEQLAVDYAEKMGIQVSDTVDCYTLDEKNKRISWLDLDKFDNHTPEEEENRNFSYAIFLYQDYFGIPGLRYDPGDGKLTNDTTFRSSVCEVSVDRDGIAYFQSAPTYELEKMGTEQEILRPADIIEKQVEMMKSKEETGEMKLSEVSLEYLPVYDKETELYHMCPVWACYYSQTVTHYGEVNYDSEEKYIAIYDAYTGEVLQTK